MKPALTAEEWEGLKRHGPAMLYAQSRPHGIAAAALNNQPFGFTREDVEMLRRIETAFSHAEYKELRSLADRIEALLPPATE